MTNKPSSVARCPCCGTGSVQISGGRQSEGALLRGELIRVWDRVVSLENMVTSIHTVTSEAIARLAADLNAANHRVSERDSCTADLTRQLAVYAGMRDGSGKDTDVPNMTLAEYRQLSAEFEAAKRGDNPAKVKKKAGGQPNHRGSSRKGSPKDGTLRFCPGICLGCGRTDMAIVATIRKRVLDLAHTRRDRTEQMYIILKGRCPGCGAETVPHTDTIFGTSFGPRLRATIVAYERAHNTEADMQLMLADIENLDVSVGAISNCITAMANHICGSALCIPDEKPIVQAVDMRGYRSPVTPPHVPDTDYHKQEAALTQFSNMWTSFMPQPAMISIMERASMDPYVRTDETGHHVGRDRVQVSIAETIHTTQIMAIPHRDAQTLQGIWGWMADRPAMRDGTRGYEWHRGPLTRCNVHLLRDAEESSMKHGPGSPQYDRHQMMKGVYHDANRIRREVERRAGGPLRCASELNTINRMPCLSEFVNTETARLADRVRAIIDSFPQDSVATTLNNALPHMFTAISIPGKPLHNNDTERSFRDRVVVDRRRVRFPDWMGARNFSVHRTFAATCERNGLSAYEAVILMAQDSTWDIFTHGIPPPIFGGGAAQAGCRAASAKPI